MTGDGSQDTFFPGIPASVPNMAARACVKAPATSPLARVDIAAVTLTDCGPNVEPPKPVRAEAQTFNVEQAKRFLRAIKNDRFEAFYLLAVATGLRRGELLGLKWEDVDLERDMLHVRRSLSRDGKSFGEPKSAKGYRR